MELRCIECACRQLMAWIIVSQAESVKDDRSRLSRVSTVFHDPKNTHPACPLMATVTPLNLHQSINRLAVNLQPLESALGINIREQACCLVAYVKATGWRYSCFPRASRIKAEDMFRNSSPCGNDAGFLQKNNSMDEKSRMVGALKESPKNQMCDNSEHFTRAETDFSNLFSRGNDQPHSKSF